MVQQPVGANLLFDDRGGRLHDVRALWVSAPAEPLPLRMAQVHRLPRVLLLHIQLRDGVQYHYFSYDIEGLRLAIPSGRIDPILFLFASNRKWSLQLKQ